MSRKENFEKLYKTVEDIKETFDEREKVIEELAAIRSEAKQFFDDTVQNYREEEERLDRRIAQEKQKCEEWAAEFRALSTEKTKSDLNGENFLKNERYMELREYLSTYHLTIQGMEATRDSIVISARAQQMMEQYRSQGTEKIRKTRSMADTISMLLGKLKGEDALNCLASFEFIPGQENFMPAEFDEWKELRMEELEELKWDAE